MKIPAFSKTYSGRCVLQMSETELLPGKIYAVIGANGSGKSTLAKVLSGAERPDGAVSLAPEETVGYLPQKSFAFRMSVRQNVLINGADRSRADDLIDALGLSPLSDKPAQRMSGGETARMALARLLMRDYGIIVLDEPCAAMDIEYTERAERVIREYRDRTGCTVVLITHSLAQVNRMADEIIFLSGGRVMSSGAADKLLSAPSSPELKRFLEFYA